MSEAIWITEAEVVRLFSLPDAIPALEEGLRLEAKGEAETMPKAHAVWSDGAGHTNTLHAIGAVMQGAGLIGTKTWAHTTGGACPLLILFDSANGSLQAIIEAFALGQYRTGGLSGVATHRMARADADEMGLVGTGKQAITQVAAVAAVRPLKRLRVYSPTPEKRRAFIERVRKAFAFEVVEVDSVEAAVADCPIVTLVTRATEAFLTADMLAPGTHLNAVGAITPERREFTQDVFDRTQLIAVDSPDTVRRLNAEFIEQFVEGDGDWNRVQKISALVAADAQRPADCDLSLFKAMGMGLSDLSLGRAILAAARAQGVGREIPQPVKVPPRLT